MNPSRWQQIEEIFQNVVDLTPKERSAFLKRECQNDSELKTEVEKLLNDYDSADSFIESPVWTDSFFINSSAKKAISDSFNKLPEEAVDKLIGKNIGVYQLTEEIGKGGMGAVYLGTRTDGSFRQTVAVKLIKRGMDTDFVLKRFRQERQILANLNHPNIALLLDGGTTDDDLPYFVMEFIEGSPLYKFCDQKKLNINERLKLFRHILDAIDFAHQNKIIHRDIKPPNILITKNGTPKLLDFGIAKVLNPEFGVDITVDPTATAMRLMTPEYASPEQVCGNPVSPASDIYSLGILLYELLTGHRPYRFQNRSPHEIARVICEEEPLRPSTEITHEDNLLPTNASEATTLSDIFMFRGAANIETLQKQIAGDLEKIILKCLRKEPTERYQTAAELAADITRYLENKPVAAETYFPAAAAATISDKKSETKSVAVLPLKVLSPAAANADTGEDFLSIGLADALVTRLSGLKRIIVRPTSSVLRFGETDDAFAAGRELGVNFIVDGNIRRVGDRIRVTAQLLNVAENSTSWSESFDEKFTDVLELEDSISGRVVKSLIPQLTSEEEEQLNKRGTNSPKAYEAYLHGRYYWNQFTPDALLKAREAFQKAIELDPSYATAYVGLADFYLWAGVYGMIPSAEGVQKAQDFALKAIELDENLGEAYASLGLSYQNRFEWEKGYESYERALQIAPNYVHAHEWFSASLVGHGNTEKGVEEIKIAERLDPLSLRTKTLTAWTLYQAHKFDEALERGRQIIEMDANYWQGYSQIGIALLALGKTDESLSYLQKFDQMIPDSALAKFQLCFAYAAANRRDDAKQILDEIKQLASNNYVKPFFLAMAYAALDEADEAFVYFEQAIDESEPWMLWFGTEPMLEKLHNDGRFLRLLEKMNNPLAEKLKTSAQVSRPTTNPQDKKSIAVLPLRIIGTRSGDDEYLAVGLADAMITRLSNVRRIVVRPTATVLRFAETEDAIAAGRELAVDFVLAGTIRRHESRIRISAQLLDVRAETTVWADKFNEELTDVLDLEDLVAEKVGTILIPQLTGEEQRKLGKRGTDNAQAFDAYMRARFNLYLLTPDGFANAKNYFETAIRLDKNYALAFVGLADYYFALTTFGTMPPLIAYPKAREMAEKALELDESLGEAYTVLAFVSHEKFDFTAMGKNIRRSIQLNPNHALARVWFSTLQTFYGRGDEAVREATRAVELNPVSVFERQHQAWIFYHNHRFEEALKLCEAVVKAEPNFAHGLGVYSRILHGCGNRTASLEAAHRAFELSRQTPWIAVNYATALAFSRENKKAREILCELENLPAEIYVTPYCLAIAYINLGEPELAFEFLEEAFRTRDIWLIWINSDPQLDALRDNVRFQNLLERVKNYSS